MDIATNIKIFTALLTVYIVPFWLEEWEPIELHGTADRARKWLLNMKETISCSFREIIGSVPEQVAKIGQKKRAKPRKKRVLRMSHNLKRP